MSGRRLEVVKKDKILVLLLTEKLGDEKRSMGDNAVHLEDKWGIICSAWTVFYSLTFL